MSSETSDSDSASPAAVDSLSCRQLGGEALTDLAHNFLSFFLFLADFRLFGVIFVRLQKNLKKKRFGCMHVRGSVSRSHECKGLR